MPDDLLTQYADHLDDGRWSLHAGTGLPVSEDQALRLIGIGVALGVPPSDVLSGEMFARLVDRVVALEQRVLEQRVEEMQSDV